MTCDYCSVDAVAHYGVLTRLGHRVSLCDACAGEHGIARHTPRRKRPPARDGPDDRPCRQLEILPWGQT